MQRKAEIMHVVPRVDLITRKSCTEAQLAGLPEEHPNLRRFEGRIIAVPYQHQLCGNVDFNYVPTLGNGLPRDLGEHQKLFEAYLVHDAVEEPAVEWGYSQRMLQYTPTRCGDGGRKLRKFREGRRGLLRTAAKPTESVWAVNVRLSLQQHKDGVVNDPWSWSALPQVADYDQQRNFWFVTRGCWRDGKIFYFESFGESWIDQKDLGAFPWLEDIVNSAKDVIRADPRVPQWLKQSPLF